MSRAISAARRIAVGLCLLLAAATAHARNPVSAANPWLTEFDPFWSGFFGVCGTKKVIANYTGPLVTVRRQTDQATLAVYPSYTGWPDPNVLATFAQGSRLFVTDCYDQTGQGRDMPQTVASVQPELNMAGSHPTLHFDGYGEFLSLGNYLPLINGVSGLTAVAVRAKDTANTLPGAYLFSLSTSASASNLQFGMGLDVTAAEICAGRRLTTDSLGRTTGFALDTAWHVQTCRLDYANALAKQELATSQTEIKNPFESAGTAPAANAVSGQFGTYLNGAYQWSGDVTMIGFAQGAAADAATTAWTTALADLFPVLPASTVPFPWGNATRQGASITTPVTGQTTNLVIMPTGATPVQTDPTTHQYHHHTRVAEHNGRRWVAASSNASAETDAGMATVVTSSANGWATQTALAFAFPPASNWGDTSAAARGVIARTFYIYNGNLYLTAQISTAAGTGLALVAVQCNDDGTLGMPFLISPGGYTPNPGFPGYTYDPVLGPSLYAQSSVYGQYDDGGAADPWHGITLQGGVKFCERGAIPLDSTGLNIGFIWRVCSGNGQGYSFYSVTHDGDATESALVPTSIPANTSPTAGALLPDGRTVTVGNPFPNRTMQYIAVWSGGTMQSLRYTIPVASVRPYIANSSTNAACSANYDPTLPQNNCVPNTPEYPASDGTKNGGCAYPGVWVDTDENLLLISCSIAKEGIFSMAIPIGNL